MKNTTMLTGVNVLALIWSAPAMAQDDDVFEGYGELLVTADRAFSLPEDEFGGSATVLTAQQVRNRQVRDIAEILRDAPGVAVSTTPGQTQVRLRGTEANHVLVLVDGIEVSDPGSGEYDLGTLQAEIGSEVEVLRGPQSALYGNDAIGGVIGYDSGYFNGFGGRIEGGTNDTINAAARWGYAGETVLASLSATVVSTDGAPNARSGTRDIGRDSYTISGKFSADLSDTFELRAVGRYVDTSGDTNNQDFTFGSPTLGLVVDSPGVGFENEAIYGLLGARLEVLDGSWVHDLSAQIADIDRNTFDPAGLTSETASDRFKLSYVSAYDFDSDEHSLTFAADYEVEGFNNIATFNDRREVENVGLVGQYRYSGERLGFSAAVRQDFNDRFRDATTFRLGAVYHASDTTRLRAAAGTGVKNPTFFELFGFFDGLFVGNPDLEPEESFSWEVGVDQRLFDGAAELSITWFSAELDSEIVTTFPAPTFVQTPVNAGTESRQEGLEVALNAQIGRQWSLNAAYTYLDAEENGLPEVRRPESIASAALTWAHPQDKASATLVVRHNGEALDSDFTTGAFPAPVRALDDFTLVNLNARVALRQNIGLFARAENLLDETYEQVFTFVSPGRTVIAGVSVRF